MQLKIVSLAGTMGNSMEAPQNAEKQTKKDPAWHPAIPLTGMHPEKILIWKYTCNPMFIRVQLLSRIRLFATPWTVARQASLSITISQSLLKFMSIELLMPSNHLILYCLLLLCPLSFPASGSFHMSQFFESSGQSIGFQLQHQSFQWIFRTDFL